MITYRENSYNWQRKIKEHHICKDPTFEPKSM